MGDAKMETRERLDLFVRRANELRNSRAVQKGLKVHTAFKYERGAGARIESETPDKEELRSFLVTWRKFFLKKQAPINLASILNLGHLCTTNDEYRKRLSEAREALKEVRTRPFLALQVNGKTLTPEETADVWINATMFHEDAEKTVVLEQMTQEHFAAVLFERAFLDHVIDTTQIILYVAEVINTALQEGVIDPGRATATK